MIWINFIQFVYGVIFLMKKIVIILLSLVVVIALVICIGLYIFGDAVVDGFVDFEYSKSDKSADLVESDIPVSSKELKEIKDNISKVDKIKVATIIIQRLSSEEINNLKDMANNGITSSEKAKIKDIIYNNLTVDEVDEIKDMYKKYKDSK